jgi:hypothetical protein
MDVKIKVKPTKSEADGMKNVYDILASGARSIERSFTEPDDDWEPVWVVITPDGQGTMLGSEMHKHTTAEIVGSYARKVGAHVVGYIGSTWSLDSGAIPESERKRIWEMVEAGTPVSEMPYRTEAVTITLYSASQIQLYTAEITRFEDKPPVLGDFTRFDLAADISGAMVEPVQAGLRRMG